MVTDRQNPFVGVWRRDYLSFDDGARETKQRVLWIQSECLFADVRSVPIKGLLTPARYERLDWRDGFTTFTGFSGHFSWRPSSDQTVICSWQQDIGIFPTDEDDIGECRWIDQNSFMELGSYADDRGRLHSYEEKWTRIAQGPVQIYEYNHPVERGRCLVADNWAIVIHDWREPGVPILSSPDVFSSFSATAWLRQGYRWRKCFSTAPLLGQTSPWTPAVIMISHHWQHQSPQRPEVPTEVCHGLSGVA